jgi:hypothetical protein
MGVADKDRRGGEEKKRNTTRAYRSAPADHCRPATAGAGDATKRACISNMGRLRVRGNPNRTPSFIRWRMGRLGQPSLGGPFTGRPAHRLHNSLHSRSPSDPPPLNFPKVQKNPMNFNLALKLLSFIYSDLLVLYIYNLDLELLCNFMLC